MATLYKLKIYLVCGERKKKLGNEGGLFEQPYQHGDKDALLKYIIVTGYNKYNAKIIEYPTISKYKLYEDN